ncbi:MAG: uncharacterized protein K0Q91_309 [Fibrobacteria bacterium]|nr:uncharacterized protein [Fibrobacteria bacterium]
MNFSFLSDALVRTYLRWTGKKHLIPLFNSLRHAGRPADISFPAELVEQGLSVILAGLNNTLAVQSNPTWVWPWWVERQIDPDSAAFLPTGTNVIKNNLTARNWTALGANGSQREAMIDPVGMATLRPYGWSFFSYLRAGGANYLPPRLQGVRQELLEGTLPCIRTAYPAPPGLEWTSEALAVKHGDQEWLVCTHRARNLTQEPRALILGIAVRPYNPLMFSPIGEVGQEGNFFRVNGKNALYFPELPKRVTLSNRWQGDSLVHPDRGLDQRRLVSKSGMLSAVAEFDLEIPAAGEREIVCVGILSRGGKSRPALPSLKEIGFARDNELNRLRAAEKTGLRIEIPHPALDAAFRAVKGRLNVFDDGDRFSPGSFLYHGHWFRDSAFIALAFDQMGMRARVAGKMDRSLERQEPSGFFRSQNGEWDSNGQALWTLIGHVQRGGDPALLARAWPALMRGARWIDAMRRRGRTGRATPASLHYGLLPAGFSAEHFGPNDHYYWDNFWSLAGLEKLLWAARFLEKPRETAWIEVLLTQYRAEVEASIRETFKRAGGEGLPCSPYRGIDSAAVGNLAAVSPLAIVDPRAEWVAETVEFLVRGNLRDGLFLQKIIHTGLNPYLSAQLARALMHRQDPRAFDILEALLRHGGPTLAWPEAIHPRTGGGCMGDGDHGWAAAEFLNLIRDLLVREEPGRGGKGSLLLLSGAPEGWFRPGAVIRAEGAPTLHGDVAFRLECGTRSVTVEWSCARREHQDPANLVLCLPAAFARARGIDGDFLGPHLRIPLPELSGSLRFHSDPRPETLRDNPSPTGRKNVPV